LPDIEKRKRQHNKKEAIKLLGKDIAALRKRGYTLEQVSEVLRGKGLDIAERTLRNYLQQRKRPVKKASVIQGPP
jgi:lambda repressor-like predicted transcriptional regulator